MSISQNTYNIAQRHKTLIDSVHDRFPLITIGGWAVDCHVGRITRDHLDVDYLCPRDYVDSLKEVLETLGYTYKLFSLPKEPNFLYKLSTQDKDNTFTFHLVDIKEDGVTEMSLWHFPHYIMPPTYYKPCPTDFRIIH